MDEALCLLTEPPPSSLLPIAQGVHPRKYFPALGICYQRPLLQQDFSVENIILQWVACQMLNISSGH